MHSPLPVFSHPSCAIIQTDQEPTYLLIYAISQREGQTPSTTTR